MLQNMLFGRAKKEYRKEVIKKIPVRKKDKKTK